MEDRSAAKSRVKSCSAMRNHSGDWDLAREATLTLKARDGCPGPKAPASGSTTASGWLSPKKDRILGIARLNDALCAKSVVFPPDDRNRLTENGTCEKYESVPGDLFFLFNYPRASI